MQPLQQNGPHQLDWTYDKRTHWLNSDGVQYATLKWAKGVSLYVGESADGLWSFKRTGIFQTRFTIRPENSCANAAALGVSDSGGELVLSDQTTVRWAAEPGKWRLVDDAEHALIETSAAATNGEFRGTVDLSDASLRLPECSLLVLFGWYVLVLLEQDDVDADTTAIISTCLP